MALTAKFLADFSSFYDAAQKAEVSVKNIGAGAATAGKQLDKMVEQFSSKKLVQEASLMVRAVEEIGGAAMLTEADFKRVGATMAAALDQMRKAQQPIPAEMQKLADATKAVEKNTGSMSTAFSVAAGNLGAMAAQFVIDRIVGFASEILNTADALVKMSDKTGISIERLQQFEAVAANSGNSVEDITRAILGMEAKIAGGDKAAAAALDELRLNTEQFKKLAPEDQFVAISDALRKVDDPARQVALAIDLMGKAGVEALPTLKAGFDDVADAAGLMGTHTARALDEFGDQIGGSAKWLKNQFAEAFADIVTLSTSESRRMADAWEKQIERVAKAAPKLPTIGIDKAPGLPADLDAIMKGYEGQAEALKKQADAAKEAKRALDAYNDTQRRLIDRLSGGGLIDKANEYAEAIKKTIPISQMTREVQDDINKVMDEAITVYKRMGVEAPESITALYAATIKAVPVIEDLGRALSMLPQNVQGFTLATRQTVSAIGALVGAATDVKPGVFANLKGTLGKGITTAIQGALQGGGNVSASVGAVMGNELGGMLAEKAGKAIGSKLGSTIGSAVGSVVPVFGTILGGLAGKFLGEGLGKLFGKSEESKSVSPLRDKLVAAAGGINELNKQAVAAGVSLDAMLKAKTVDDYNAAIKELGSAFEFQNQSLQVALDTAQRYGFTLEELGPALQRQELDKQAQQLYKDWQVLNAAGIDTVAITEHMSESISAYLQQAMSLGTEVPNAMRPMLESMAKSGQLVDANGNKIEDLEAAGISFSLSMSEGFKELITQVTKLTDAISRGLGLAVDETSKKIAAMPNTVDVEVVYHDPGFTPSGSPVELESYATGSDGFRNFGSGTPVMLHGWEAVVPRESSDAGALALTAGSGPAGGAAPVVNITINADGAFFDTPGDLQRLADRVNEALTAKYGLTHRMRAA